MSLSRASITQLAGSPQLTALRPLLLQERIIERAIRLQQIPAPTFQEEARAIMLAQEFTALGLQDVETDELHNVYGWLAGEDPAAPALLLSAHTDTVFDAQTDLSIRREGGRLYGPGLGDNSLGVASLLTLADAFVQGGLSHRAPLCFLANSREEGLGDLGGMRAAVTKLQARLGAAIILEGMALGRIYHGGIAVRRFKVSVHTPGGHSWLHFGAESAVHRLMQFGSRITQLEVPSSPRTTYNIAPITGGTSVNTIAAHASAYLDLRSEDTQQVQHLEAQLRQIAADLTAPQVKFDFEEVGNRPAGRIPTEHPLVRLALEAHEAIRMQAELDSGSTDANIPLSLGIPAVCVGVSYGGNAHRLDEYIETEPIEKGIWQLLLLVAAAANALPGWARP